MMHQSQILSTHMLQISFSQLFKYYSLSKLMPKDEEKFTTFTLPDVSNVDPTIITKFSNKGPDYRTIYEGLNLEGQCKNKDCPKAYKKLVWTRLGFGTFHMSQVVRNCKCPSCGKPTKGNKKIGIYQCILTGKGMRVPNNNETNEESTMETQGEDTDDEQNQNTEKQETFPRIQVKSDEGFLKMDGKNGKMVKWYYMTLKINKLID